MPCVLEQIQGMLNDTVMKLIDNNTDIIHE